MYFLNVHRCVIGAISNQFAGDYRYFLKWKVQISEKRKSPLFENVDVFIMVTNKRNMGDNK